MGKYFLLFTIIPLIELYLLTMIGAQIGFPATVALVVVTGALGGWLARYEGARVWRKWLEALGEGRLPDEGVVGGVLLLVGGVLLVTPGVMTDVVGLSLLIPFSRAWIADGIVRPWLERRVQRVTADTGIGSGVIGGAVADAVVGRPERPAPQPAGDVVTPDAIFERVDRPRGPRVVRAQVIDADFEVIEGDRHAPGRG